MKRTKAQNDEALIAAIAEKTTMNPSEHESLLMWVAADIAQIKDQLTALSAKYRDGGQDRIGWEVLQAVRALDEAMHLARVYLSTTK